MANDPWFKKVTLLSHLETAPVVDPNAQYLIFGHHCDSADAVDVTGKACSYVGVKNSQWAMVIDANTPLPTNLYLDGYVDEWRVTKGVGRYLADFTPPNGQFPSAATGVSGVVKESDGSPRSCKVFAYSHATGALIGSAVSDPSTGVFYIAVPERCYCVCLDDDVSARNAIVYDRLDPV